MTGDVFSSMALFSFAVLTLASGLFTAYFGAGASRRIGTALVVVGLVGLFLFVWFTGLFALDVEAPVRWSSTAAVDGILGLVGAIVGGALAVVLFLASIMKA